MKNARFRNHIGFWAVALFALGGAASCGGDDDHHDEGKATGSVCPAGNTLTYDSFGRNFMAKYCTRCHSSTVMGDMREGAPADHNFDTFAGIFKMADHIDEHAAAGPDAVNTAMPPSDPKPSEEERKQLGQWLACETKDDDGGGTGDGGSGDGGGSGDTGSRGDTGGAQDMGRDGDGRGGG
jgi:cytochrome c5